MRHATTSSLQVRTDARRPARAANAPLRWFVPVRVQQGAGVAEEDEGVYMINIYGLYDPREPAVVRYIGKTEKALVKRLSRHLSEARAGTKNFRCNWIRKLLSFGVTPEIRLLEECKVEDWQAREKHWIALHKLTITNGTMGGDGLSAPSDEIRKKISAANKGRFLGKKMPERSSEHRQALSKSLKGRQMPSLSEERKAALSEASRNRIWTDEQRRKVSEATKGKKKRPLTDEEKLRLSENQKGRIFSDEHEAKISLAKKRENLSEETLKRMSDAAKRRNAIRYGSAKNVT